MIEKYDKIEIVTANKINATKIPLNRLALDASGVKEFNKLYQKLIKKIRTEGWHPIERNPETTCIKTGVGSLRLPAYEIDARSGSVSLIILCEEGQTRVVIGPTLDKSTREVSGRQAFLIFRKCCEKFGIDLMQLAVENGDEIKKKIPKPIIKIERESYKDLIFDNAYHVDLNSSHMAGAAEAFPVLADVIKYIYSRRKESYEFKQVLTHTFGFCQSQWCNFNGYRFCLANISLSCLEYTNRRVTEIAESAKKAGATILLYNTDGFWAVGPKPDDPDQGYDLGQWKIDHKNCKLRIKSSGAYEFLENGIYTPVLRGRTRLDNIKDRSKWNWGDIYRADAAVCKYYFDEEIGMVEVDPDAE